MWRRNEESKVMSLIEEHLKKVEECLRSMLSTMENYLQGKIDTAESYISRTHDAESEADEIRRKIDDSPETIFI